MSSRNVVGFSSSRNQESRSPLMSIQQRMNDLFDNFFTDVDSVPSFSSSDVRFPLLNVSETDKDITVKAELPGMEEQDIKLEVDKNYLTIKGEKKSETEEKDKEGRHHLREISYGSFSRTLNNHFPKTRRRSKHNQDNSYYVCLNKDGGLLRWLTILDKL